MPQSFFELQSVDRTLDIGDVIDGAGLPGGFTEETADLVGAER